MRRIEIKLHKEIELEKQEKVFGVFFEDINHAADGGLYGEMVRNRSFEFDIIDNSKYNHLTAWEKIERGNSIVQVYVDEKNSLNNQNLHYVRIEVITEGKGGGIRNEGFGKGFAIREGENYHFSCFYRRKSFEGSFITVQIESKDGKTVFAKKSFYAEQVEWSKWECDFISNQTDYEAKLSIYSDKPLTFDIDMISLFPETFLNRKNGLRKDIAEMIQEMEPAFVRFPGGCLVHIGSLDADARNSIYRWKNTLGKIEERPARRNSWDYNQTLGLGYYEFFQFCEDIGAEPMPVIPAGFDPHFLRVAPIDQMHEWIAEACDLIEFANGDMNSEWGSVRAKLGHPECFHLKYLAIGNEEVGDEFFERYRIIAEAVKERFPDIKIIGSAGPGSSGSEFDKGWKIADKTNTDYVDEHYYQSPDWFIANAERYDAYPKQEAKAFLGEYASKGNKWINALSEAVFMIGLEKAPALGLACYAPLLCNIDYVNWPVNLLYYNNNSIYGSANYHIQKLFMKNQARSVLRTSDNIHKNVNNKTCELTGIIALSTEKADIIFTDIIITDNITGKITIEKSVELSAHYQYHECAKINSSKYMISFTFEKLNGKLSTSLSGSNSFSIEFAKKDENNKLFWNIDGWERTTSVQDMRNGFTSDLGLHLYQGDWSKKHKGKMIIDGNKVVTYIDDVKYSECFCQNSEPEELYYSAVRDKERTIIKIANAEDSPKDIIIETYCYETREAEVFFIDEVNNDAENSFEEQNKISPKRKMVPVVNGKIEYTVKGFSFTIIIVK